MCCCFEHNRIFCGCIKRINPCINTSCVYTRIWIIYFSCLLSLFQGFFINWSRQHIIHSSNPLSLAFSFQAYLSGSSLPQLFKPTSVVQAYFSCSSLPQMFKPTSVVQAYLSCSSLPQLFKPTSVVQAYLSCSSLPLLMLFKPTSVVQAYLSCSSLPQLFKPRQQLSSLPQFDQLVRSIFEAYLRSRPLPKFKPWCQGGPRGPWTTLWDWPTFKPKWKTTVISMLNSFWIMSDPHQFQSSADHHHHVAYQFFHDTSWCLSVVQSSNHLIATLTSQNHIISEIWDLLGSSLEPCVSLPQICTSSKFSGEG